MGILERDEANDEGEHGAGKGGANPVSEGRPNGRLPSLASAFLPRRGDPQPRSDGVRRESD